MMGSILKKLPTIDIDLPESGQVLISVAGGYLPNLAKSIYAKGETIRGYMKMRAIRVVETADMTAILHECDYRSDEHHHPFAVEVIDKDTPRRIFFLFREVNIEHVRLRHPDFVYDEERHITDFLRECEEMAQRAFSGQIEWESD